MFGYSLLDGILDALGTPTGQVIGGLTAFAMLCAVAAYVVGKIRRQVRESDPGPSEFMTNFRELHSQGELSDEEYRTIKAMLASRLQEQWKAPPKEKPKG
jgi:uncharacterized membrane protein